MQARSRAILKRGLEGGKPCPSRADLGDTKICNLRLIPDLALLAPNTHPTRISIILTLQYSNPTRPVPLPLAHE